MDKLQELRHRFHITCCIQTLSLRLGAGSLATIPNIPLTLMMRNTRNSVIEPEAPSTITTKDIVDTIMKGKPASPNPEAALQKIFSILAVFTDQPLSYRIRYAGSLILKIRTDITPIIRLHRKDHQRLF